MHYRRMQRAGTGMPPALGPMPPALNLEARFLSRVVVDADGCWLWNGVRLPKGYGVLGCGKDRAREGLAHRWAYRLFVGPIPDGFEVDHLCGVTSCVNPSHLEAVPGHENARRAALRHHGPTCSHGNTRGACPHCDARAAYMRSWTVDRKAVSP